MRRLVVLLCTGLVVLAVAGTVTAVSLSSSTGGVAARPATVAFTLPAVTKKIKDVDNPAAPDEYMDDKDSSGQVVTRAQVEQARAQAAAVPAAQGTQWSLVGPTNIGGRVVDLVVDPTTTPETLFVATSGGGIWKSTDQGMTFTPAWPSTYTQTMGSIARAPNGTLWVGTGEANPSGGGTTFEGTGLYKSTDDGNTWSYVALGSSGAIGRIAVNPNNSNEIWVAASGSIYDQADYTQTGLYHSTDGGQTWTLSIPPVNSTTGAIDVAVDPNNTNIVWAALWDHHRDNGARVYGGVGSGLYRTTNDGASWTRLNNTNISGPICSYDDPQGTVASGKGTLTSGSPTLDITTLTAGTFSVGDRITGTDITSLSPATPTTILAVSNPGGTISATNPIVITMSANATGTVTTAETITDTGVGSGLNSDPSLGRIGVAIAPSNPNIVYFVDGAPYGPEKGFYASSNGESATPTFTCGGDAYAASGYQWWFGRIWVDPNNPLHLFNADVDLRTSANGGQTWANVSQPHSDQHAMEWDPNNSPSCEAAATCVIYLGNDGGIYHSTDNGGLTGATNISNSAANWTHATYEPWNQSYHLGVSTTDNTRLNTGLQDNGSVKTWSNAVTEPTDLTQWTTSGGGDGHWNLIDPTNEHVYYECSQNASCTGDQDDDQTLAAPAAIGATNIDLVSATGVTARGSLSIGTGATDVESKTVSTVGTAGAGANGGTVVTLTTGLANAHSAGEAVTYTVSWSVSTRYANSTVEFTTDAPLALDPLSAGGPSNGGGTAENVFYVGGSVLGRSTNQGQTMTAISPQPPATTLPGPIPANEVDLGGEYSNEYGTITAIAPYGNTVYVGTDTGLVWKTTNAAANPATSVAWTQLGTGQNGQSLLPTRWVNSILVDPNNTNHVIIAFSGYREGYNGANVYESYDGGTTWANISGNLPNAPVEQIRYDSKDGVLYAGTDLGVFYLGGVGQSSDTSNASWTTLSTGLPNTPVLDIQLSGDDRTLFAATFGRSVWELPLSQSVLSSVGATVPGQLALTISSATPSFGTFVPGVAANYSTSIGAGVTTTAQNTVLTAADLSSPPGIAGQLYNPTGSGYSLTQPLQVDGSSSGVGATGSSYTNLSATPVTVVSYNAPISNDSVTIGFNQPIAATDPLRTGQYSKTITFTLSTSTL